MWPVPSFLPGTKPRPFGNAVYVDLAVGQSYQYLGRTIRLEALDHDGATIAVDGARQRLIVARRSLPARLRQILHKGTPAEVVNSVDYLDFEVAVEAGEYAVSIRVGDHLAPSWQKVFLGGADAGTYQLEANEFVWTPEKIVTIRDAKLPVRLELRDANNYAGVSQLSFRKKGTRTGVSKP